MEAEPRMQMGQRSQGTNGESGHIELDGSAASTGEIERARHTVQLLEGLLPKLTEPAHAAQAMFEIATLLEHPLGETTRSLEMIRQALAV